MHEAAIKVGARLRDRWLCARLFDGFILPWLHISRVKTSDALSRQRLLMNATGAYRLAGEADKQVAVLQVLVATAEAQKNAARADWARIKLAEVLAARQQNGKAIANLKAVRSPNLRGSSGWIAELEAKQREQEEWSRIPKAPESKAATP